MPFLGSFDLLASIEVLIPVLISLSFHEFAHAWSAYKLGDDTAARLGRMTVNPIAHIDPIGTLLLPLLGIPFGWAKPVPINPTRFRSNISMAFGMMLTALAGPLMNLLLSVLSIIAFFGLERFAPGHVTVEKFLMIMFQVNIALGVFNLIPIPPLDGSRVVNYFLPYRFRPFWARIERLGFFLLPLCYFARHVIAWPASLLMGAFASFAHMVIY